LKTAVKLDSTSIAQVSTGFVCWWSLNILIANAKCGINGIDNMSQWGFPRLKPSVFDAGKQRTKMAGTYQQSHSRVTQFAAKRDNGLSDIS
jgi:hypothetical protein